MDNRERITTDDGLCVVSVDGFIVHKLRPFERCRIKTGDMSYIEFFRDQHGKLLLRSNPYGLVIKPNISNEVEISSEAE